MKLDYSSIKQFKQLETGKLYLFIGSLRTQHFYFSTKLFFTKSQKKKMTKKLQKV